MFGPPSAKVVVRVVARSQRQRQHREVPHLSDRPARGSAWREAPGSGAGALPLSAALVSVPSVALAEAGTQPAEPLSAD